MTPETQRVIRKIIFRYKRSCWWVDENELHQQAIVLYYESLPSYDELFGDEHSYMYRPIAQGLARYIRAQSTVVTTPITSPSCTDIIRNIKTTEYENDFNQSLHDPYEQFVQAEMRYRVRKAVKKAADRTKFGGLALPVLLSDSPPREVAKQQKVDAVTVHRAVAQVKTRLRKDKSFAKLKEYLKCLP